MARTTGTNWACGYKTYRNGQLPGLYSSKQRALFGVLARLRGQRADNDQLAKIVVFAWAYSNGRLVG